MKPNHFIRLRLIHVPTQMEDIITGHSFDFGATGVTEALSFSQPDLTYDPNILHGKTHDLDVYFTEPPVQEYFDKLLEYAPRLTWQIFEEENKDWLEEWKKGFKPFSLVGPYWVIPSWFEAPPEAKFPIFIDPGMAFGTGTHATTKMAAYFVHKLSKSLPNPQEKSLIDVGTGTGILAMLAAHHDVGQIKGIEIDPEARRVARENIEKNKMSDKVEITDQLLENIKEPYDIVVANIIDGVLIQLRDQLLSILAPGGHLFLTGILLEREEIFLDEFIKVSGLETFRRIEEDEWVGYWMKVRSN